MTVTKKLAFGLCMTSLTLPAVWAESTVIGTYNKAESASSTTETSTPTGAKNEAGKDGSGKIAETSATAPSSDLKGNGGTPTGTPEGTPIAIKNDGGGLTDAVLEKKIAEILSKNPQIIVKAVQDFNQLQQKAQQEKLEASLMKYKNEISKDSSAVVLGKKDAEVKLVVFLDPNCPHCRPFSLALNRARENFPNLGIFIRHWAILGKDSEEVVRGLWAIKLQGEDKFNAATKAIAASDEKFTFVKLLAWVEDHKMDVAKFKKDAEAQTTKDIIDETKKLASDIGLEGTPTSLLVDKNGIRLVMPTDEKSLEGILKGAAQDGPVSAAKDAPAKA
jgi:protein-disulfide isomerase